ncbi:MAG: DUF5670 family protein [Opitutaceae bacterium]|nr:DUF5670 family protein [Opitutaceae bacterium]
MLEITAILFFLLWHLGVVSSYTLTGYMHIALMLGIASVLVRVIRGRDIMS